MIESNFCLEVRQILINKLSPSLFCIKDTSMKKTSCILNQNELYVLKVEDQIRLLKRRLPFICSYYDYIFIGIWLTGCTIIYNSTQYSIK